MSHYFDDTSTGKFIPTQVHFRVANSLFSAGAGSGVFSKDHLDKGSRVLLKYAIITLQSISIKYDNIGLLLLFTASVDIYRDRINECNII